MENKYLLSDPNQAISWMVQFNAVASIDEVTDDGKLKALFLSKCGVQAITTLRKGLFPKTLDSCTFADIKDCVNRLKSERMSWTLSIPRDTVYLNKHVAARVHAHHSFKGL